MFILPAIVETLWPILQANENPAGYRAGQYGALKPYTSKVLIGWVVRNVPNSIILYEATWPVQLSPTDPTLSWVSFDLLIGRVGHCVAHYAKVYITMTDPLLFSNAYCSDCGSSNFKYLFTFPMLLHIRWRIYHPFPFYHPHNTILSAS